jgi:hypothetical protein
LALHDAGVGERDGDGCAAQDKPDGRKQQYGDALGHV